MVDKLLKIHLKNGWQTVLTAAEELGLVNYKIFLSDFSIDNFNDEIICMGNK